MSRNGDVACGVARKRNSPQRRPFHERQHRHIRTRFLFTAQEPDTADRTTRSDTLEAALDFVDADVIEDVVYAVVVGELVYKSELLLTAAMEIGEGIRWWGRIRTMRAYP